MEDDKKLTELLLNQGIEYLRECHKHQFDLTRSVLVLNTVLFAALGLFIRFGLPADLPDDPLVHNGLVVLGILLGSFGLVFNCGASAAHTHLHKTVGNLTAYVLKSIEGVSNQELIKPVLTGRNGKVYKLTKIFFYICNLLWTLFAAGVLFVSVLV